MIVRHIDTNLYRISETGTEFTAPKLLQMLRKNAQAGQVREVAPQTLFVQESLYLPPQVIENMEQVLGTPVHQLVWGIR